jgi:hypothetical protein
MASKKAPSNGTIPPRNDNPARGRSRRNTSVKGEKGTGTAKPSSSGSAQGPEASEPPTIWNVTVGSVLGTQLVLSGSTQRSNDPRGDTEATALTGGSPPASKRNLSIRTVLIPEVIPPGSPAVPSENDEQLELFLEEASLKISDGYVSVMMSMRNTIRHACSVGHELLAVKGRLAHGRFEDWVEANCPFSLRTARAYMRLTKGASNLPLDCDPERHPPADLTLERALKMLSKPKPRVLETAGSTSASSGRPTSQPKPESDVSSDRDVDEPTVSDNDEDAEEAIDDHLEPAWSRADSRADSDGSDVTDSGSYDEPESPAKPMAIIEDREVESSDEEWLANLPVRKRLANPAIFDADALLWRRVQDSIEQLLQDFRPSPYETRTAADPARAAKRYHSRLAFLTGVTHPREWMSCWSCRGRGRSPGTRETCAACDGSGYGIRHVAADLD